MVPSVPVIGVFSIAEVLVFPFNGDSYFNNDFLKTVSSVV